jgi:hypothetical protein
MTPDEAHDSGLAPATRPCQEEQYVPHLVKYTKADGQAGDHEVDGLHDAVSYVERLRNEQGAESARIFRLEEVTFEFKAYYRVEIGGTSSPTAQQSAAAPSPVPADDVPVAPLWEPPAENTTGPETAAPAAETAAIDTVAAIDPWADAPPPPAPAPARADEVETAGVNGRRGLFGR